MDPNRPPVYATGPMTGRRAALFQSWRHLLFLHWRFDPAVIERTLPPGLEVQTFDGAAWIGIVPFFMHGVRPRRLPALPHVSRFLELNVRTYVTGPGRVPGIWFYSLDANRRLAVVLARALFHLPYEHAEMAAAVDAEGWVDYATRRRGAPRDAVSRFRYRPRGPVREAREGLEIFLVERYLLYAAAGARLYRGRVHHAPYPVQDVETSGWDARVLELDGLPHTETVPDHILYSGGVDVEVFALERAGD